VIALAWIALLLAAVPAMLIAVNLIAYRRPRPIEPEGPVPRVSVLIPARDEEATIGKALASVLASRGVELDVVIMDDHSNDHTAEVVRRLAERDGRVRLACAPELPRGWCGKQHTCQRLSELARHPLLLFVDADVRLAPTAIRALVAELDRREIDLLSGIPFQVNATWAERLIVPLIHFVLLGYLPIPAMRVSPSASFAAGCGQLFLARRAAYDRAGGHAAIRSSRHDGLTLPRAFRAAGARTDLVDLTDLASCRMYRGAREVWLGFAKNATEGMASPRAIVPWTFLLFGGHVLPALLLAVGLATASPGVVFPASLATLLGYLGRFAVCLRFRQSVWSAALHPLGVLAVLSIQWHAAWNHCSGRSVAWKGRIQLEA